MIPSRPDSGLSFDANRADLISIAENVAANTKLIVQTLEKQGLPQPSLSANGASPDCIPANDVELQMLRNSLVRQSQLLAHTFTGPRKYLQEKVAFSVGTPILHRHVPLLTLHFPDDRRHGLGCDIQLQDPATRPSRW